MIIRSHTLILYKATCIFVTEYKTRMNLIHTIEWRVLYCTLFTNIASFMLGYSFGFPSPIAREVKSGNLLDDYQFGLFAGIFYLAAAIGGLIAIPMMFWLGRKPVIIIAAFISAAGWILLGSSRMPELLICARVITGLGSGLSTPIVPIYVAELANKNTRGRHLSVTGMFISIGLLAIFALGIGLSYNWLAMIGAIICIGQVVALIVVPYTPVYLAGIKLEVKALNTLQKLRSENNDTLSEINEIIQVVKEEEENIPLQRKIALFFRMYHLKALFVISMTMIATQSTGVNLFGSYSSELLDNERINPNIIGLVFPIFQMIGKLINLLLIDKIGRKIPLIISIIGIILTLLSMGCYLLFLDQVYPQIILNSVSNSSIVSLCESEYVISWPILNITFFSIIFSVGVGPIAFIVLGELIPHKIKHIVSGFGTFLLFMTAFIIVTLYPIITNAVPRSYFLFGLALFNVILCALIATFTPEFKGKSIGELERLFQENTIFCCKLVKPNLCSFIKKKYLKQ